MSINQETLNAILGMIGIVLANFVWTIITTIRTQRAQRRTQEQLSSTQKTISTVQEQIPAQVQTHIQQPLSDLQTQIEKSLTSSAGVMATVATTVNDLIANYQNQADNAQRQFSLVAQQLQDSLEHNRALEKQLFDNKVFIDSLLKSQADDVAQRKRMFAEIDDLKVQLEAMRQVRKVDGDRITQLTAALADTQRELTNAKTLLEDTQKQLIVIRTDREAVRQEREVLRQELEAERGKTALLQQQVETLMQEVARLKEQLAARDALDAGEKARRTVALAARAIADAHPANEAMPINERPAAPPAGAAE